MNKFLDSSDSERELRVMADNQLALSFPKTYSDCWISKQNEYEYVKETGKPYIPVQKELQLLFLLSGNPHFKKICWEVGRVSEKNYRDEPWFGNPE